MFEAVTACTRALAGCRVDDLPSAPDNVSSLATVRAEGDRVAVRRRFHDPVCHQTYRPPSVSAASLFDALEKARLDVRGLQWMPGVAVNLMGHPGPRPQPIRWLAFEILAGRQAPAAVANAVARLGATLPPRVLADLMALRPLVAQQTDFARASAGWANTVAGQGWCSAASTVITAPDTLQQAPSIGSADGDVVGPAGGFDIAEIGETPARDAPTRNEPSRATAPGASSVAANRDSDTAYTAYTTAHDRIVDAASLVGPAELAHLRARLDRELGATRFAVMRLANRLRRVLLAGQVRRWQFDLDEGWVDGRRLAGVIAAPGETRLFKQETDSPFPTAAVSLLIDHSGSMRGRPILMAAFTVELLVQVLERCGVRCEVLGFTTRDWHGGQPAREWTANGQRKNPGRLNALEHIILKAADTPWRRARPGLGLVLRTEMLKENIDGEAVLWAHARLCRRRERRRILLVVSDGAPRDEATDRANGTDYLTRHLQIVVEHIETYLCPSILSADLTRVVPGSDGPFPK